MAASSDEDMLSSSDENTQEKECFMCIFPSKKCKIVQFSDKTWSRFLEYVNKWKSLDGPQAKIARDYVAQHSAGFSADSNTALSPAIPLHGGFHHQCYARFTDSQRVERVMKSMKKKADDLASTATVPQADVGGEKVEAENTKPTKRRALRSSFGRPPVPARSQHVLPNICILCQKEKTIRCRSTRKRKKEHLVTCSTIDAVHLQQAAEDSGNVSLLMQIKDKDCVAIEVRYHNSCYRDFTRYLTRPANTQTGSDTSYSEAFEFFSKTVKTRIIDNKEIMRLKKVNDLFIKQIKISHGVEANSYKSGYLKHRLSKKFPQLCFITPHMKSQGDIVFVNDISTATLVEKQTNLQEATQSTTHSEMDSTTDDAEAPSQAGHQSQMGYVYADPNALRNTYMTALDLRQTIREVKPTMPKHMSLAMTVHHLSGSAQLIGLLNGLGHSVSNSVILNH
uniref:uncharacterized protein n=1 Tax=Myxine glutinosa TaxID=7769 RepID=UPI00358FE14D